MKPPLRICFPFSGETVGGSHISALLLIRHLERSRFEPLVVVHEPAGPLARLLREQGVACEALPVRSYPTGFRRDVLRDARWLMTTAPRLARYLRSRDVAIVHTNELRTHLAWLPPALLCGVRTVWHQRTRSIAVQNHRIALRLVDRIVGISDFAVQGIVDRVPAERVQVIYNPFETGPPQAGFPEAVAAARAEILGARARDGATRIVGFFGALLENKRPILFLETAARILAELPGRAVFALFADDRAITVAELRAFAERLGILEQMRFMGFRHPPEPWLAACDLVLAPAVREGFGRVLVEAALVGTPVVAADSGGQSEAIRHGETGYLVPPDDAEGFARQAVAVLKDPKLAVSVAKKACAAARGRYSTERHVTEMMELYDSLV
jgi:glycosyltransferase involved in cell wall biosynthesis